MTNLKTITQRMEAVMSGESWYGRSVKELLNEVNPDFVFQKPEHMPYSLAELLAHMIYWKRYIRNVMVNGEGDRDQDQSFLWKHYGEASDETWSSMLTDFTELHQSLLDCLENLKIDPDAMVPERPFTYGKLLEGAIDHDIYHIGQVILLHKFFKAQQEKRSSNGSFKSWFRNLNTESLRWVVMLK